MTITIEWFIIPLLNILDMTLTYLIMSMVKKKYRDCEMNNIVKYMWNKFGLEKGSLISGIIIFLIVIILSITMENDFKLLFIGMYTVVIYLHYNNLCTIYRERKNKNSKIVLKKYVK